MLKHRLPFDPKLFPSQGKNHVTAAKHLLPFYLLTGFFILGMKYYYSHADCSRLLWILAPTCRWVRILSGISFEWVPDMGYVSHSAHFIIAKSCSGVQFLIVSVAALNFSFLHRKKTSRQAALWVMFTLAVSYGYTIFANGFRILLSIYLPPLLKGCMVSGGWLTRERLHSITGIMVYFTALFIFYQLADSWSSPVPACSRSFSRAGLAGKYAGPLFWYFFIVLGLPLLNGSLGENRQGFNDYALLIITVCLGLVLIFRFFHWLKHQIRKRKQ